MGQTGSSESVRCLVGVMVWKQGENQLRARIYGPDGQPATGELAVNARPQGREELTAVEVDPLGTFTIRWEEYSETDDLLGWYSRQFDALGQPLGDELREGPPA